MAFNSLEYFIFFVLVFVACTASTARPLARNILLLLSSWFFYAINNEWVIILLLSSTIIDYYAGIFIQDAALNKSRAKQALLFSLFSNLGILAFFKYFNFFADSVYRVYSWSNVEHSPFFLEILLPVGISFYTFQSMSYTIDVYNGHQKAERSFIRFALFVSFFPQLVAGPIVRARNLLSQIQLSPKKLTLRTFEIALFLIATGLFKKIVMGDTLGDYADAAFDASNTPHAAVVWLGLYAFTFQIYFDFSGYSDIAIGSALLLGYRLPINFKRPYIAVSFSEFWRRWHISLSFWLRDYLYKPMGGNQKTKLTTYRNLLIVMLLGGLWHGAAWTFILWGAIHGVFLLIERALGQSYTSKKLRDKPFNRFFRSFVIYNLCAFTWLPFRSNDFSSMVEMLTAFFRTDVPFNFTVGMFVAVFIIVGGYFTHWIGEFNSFKRLFIRAPLLLKSLYFGSIFLAIVIFSSRSIEPFIYFRF